MADQPVYPRHDSAIGMTSSPSFPVVEQHALDYWAKDDTFAASVQQRPESTEYVFYDGPPFANGLPHYGHLLTGYVKDVVPRYQTMRGKRVERRFGWDCHGLPAEVEAEKQLGIHTKAEVLALGIGQFNEACRTSVLRYTGEWERYVTRQARWVDFANDYKTLDLSYMESVMWAFKTLYDKGLVYEGFRVLPYCWRCETPLSNTEIRMDDVYRDRNDPASTVWFELETGERILAWTTMPWTLIPNVAIVVGPDIDYAILEHHGHRYILAEARISAYEEEFTGAVRVGTLKGSELIGRRYRPMFDFLIDRVAGTPAFTVLGGDFVSIQDGTGIVQVSPGHGEDDFTICTEAGIPVVVMVDETTRFTSLAPPFEGLQVFEANKPLLRELDRRGTLVKQENYVHPYPHCWRCDTPLVYNAVSSWFVQVTAFKDRMKELNQQIRWVPEHVKDGSFGKWLDNARDWSISRTRFWGTPIPVWKSDDPQYPRVDIYGSLDEIERDFGVRPADLHRPMVDELVRPNPDDPTGTSMMHRVPEVLDCWFESGSMPFAQVHYPFENREWFEDHYPGDFIVEYIAQTRGWFYTLHVLATALFDRPAFRTCMSHGVVLGNDGRKMSKSLGNYPDVYQMFDTYGSDAMRWFLMSSPILRGGDLVVTEEGIRDAVRQVMNPLWNAWYFFSLYANAEGYSAQIRANSPHVLDRYILAKLRYLVDQATTRMDAYDIAGACQDVREFGEALTNWYIRRSRDRFWGGDRDAFDTLYTVLETLTRITAPLAPMISEEIWRGLTDGRSVHCADWPDTHTLPVADELVATMDAVRTVCSAGLSLRKATKLRVRLPLASLTVATTNAEDLTPFVDVIRDETNVKEVVLSSDIDAFCSRVLSVVPRVAGPRLGSRVQRVIAAVKAGEWSVEDHGVFAHTPDGPVELREGEYELRVVPSDEHNSHGQQSRAHMLLPRDTGVVVLDTAVTPELAAEGLARDVIRVVQQARKDAALHVTDRIVLTLDGDEAALVAVRAHSGLIARETLATELRYQPVSGDSAEVGDGHTVRTRVQRDAQ